MRDRKLKEAPPARMPVPVSVPVPMRMRMRKRMLTPALAAVLATGALAAPPAAPLPARLSVGEALGTLPRYGVNLGGRSVWGADQLMNNVLRNPGLESGWDGTLAVADRVDGVSITDDSQWNARADGFWVGGSFEVLSGASAGQTGHILDDRRLAPKSPATYWLSPMPLLRGGEIVALYTGAGLPVLPNWWTQGLVRADTTQRRTGSPGAQSARLIGIPGAKAALYHHIDSIGDRAGKLLVVQGRWRLALWLRADAEATPVRLGFGRRGTPAWVQKTWIAGREWKQAVIEFDARDDGPVGPMQLGIEVDRGDVWVDDVELGAVDSGVAGFRRTVVDALRALRPGYLRDWQGQLADTPANRIAEPFARHPVRYRPGDSEVQYAYSLAEFCELAAAVGARPWVVLPSTSTPAQARLFGQQLAALWRRWHFDEIVVEHGNEHWNDIFHPAGIPKPAQLAEVADRAFAALREGAGANVPLHLVLGAKYVDPAMSEAIAKQSRQIQAVTVAPYFLYRLDATGSADEGLDRALSEDVSPLDKAQALLRPLSRELDVYEVNFHTTSGNASSAQRDAVVTSAAAGSALARRLLQATLAGVRRQAVYSFTGFDSFANGATRELVHLWGIARDIADTVHWRPTGLALELLNRVAGGMANKAVCVGAGCDTLTAVAFDSASRWAVVSASHSPVALSWPCARTQALTWLDGSVTARNNEHEVQVRLQTATAACSGGVAQFLLPARSTLAAEPAP